MLAGIHLQHAHIHDGGFSWSDIFTGQLKVSTVLSTLMLRGLEFGGFFLQFIQWWQDSSSSQRSITQLPTPDPPKLDRTAVYGTSCKAFIRRLWTFVLK